MYGDDDTGVEIVMDDDADGDGHGLWMITMMTAWMCDSDG